MRTLTIDGVTHYVLEGDPEAAQRAPRCRSITMLALLDADVVEVAEYEWCTWPVPAHWETSPDGIVRMPRATLRAALDAATAPRQLELDLGPTPPGNGAKPARPA